MVKPKIGPCFHWITWHFSKFKFFGFFSDFLHPNRIQIIADAWRIDTFTTPDQKPSLSINFEIKKLSIVFNGKFFPLKSIEKNVFGQFRENGRTDFADFWGGDRAPKDLRFEYNIDVGINWDHKMRI